MLVLGYPRELQEEAQQLVDDPRFLMEDEYHWCRCLGFGTRRVLQRGSTTLNRTTLGILSREKNQRFR
jgi:hypothetical protein